MYSLWFIWQKPLLTYSRWQVWVFSNRCFLRDFWTCKRILLTTQEHILSILVCQSYLFGLSVYLFFLMALLRYNLHTIEISQPNKYLVVQFSDFSKFIESYHHHSSVVEYCQYPVNFSHVYLQLIPFHTPDPGNYWSSFRLYKFACSWHFIQMELYSQCTFATFFIITFEAKRITSFLCRNSSVLKYFYFQICFIHHSNGIYIFFYPFNQNEIF